MKNTFTINEKIEDFSKKINHEKKLKNIDLEMKLPEKENLFDGLNSRKEMTEERTTELEDQSTELHNLKNSEQKHF